ncbi:MAG TPA: hypothetical protein VFK48_12190 [Usitatibacter sp.]|nr:hypothetical protein [Usitatibacter sp.]
MDSRAGIAALLLASAALAGCSTLLPKSRAEVQSPWRNFEEAKSAIESIEPGVSRTSDLRSLGIDPYTSPNVQILTFSDIALRFPVSIGNNRLDKGLRDCLEAGKGCTGYYLNVREVKRDRIGGFWADTLGFKRVVEVTGWSFNALLLIVDDRVVYTLYGGQPNVHEQEVSRQPLGPAQDFGESLPLGSLLR